MKCDPARLSAYLDNDLDASERLDVEQHLRRCQCCADALEAYRAVRSVVRGTPQLLAPSSVGDGLETRLERRRRRFTGAWLPVAIGAPVVFVGVLALGALVVSKNEPPADLRVTASFPPAGAQRVSVRAPIELWFDREIQSSAQTGIVTVDPPVPVRLSAQGNSLRIEPVGAFEPDQTYTVAVESIVDVDGRKLRSPAVVSFTTAAPTQVAAPVPGLGSPRGDQAVPAPAAADAMSGNREAAVQAATLASRTAVAGGAAVETAVLARAHTPKLPGRHPGGVSRSAEVPTLSSSMLEDSVGLAIGPTQSVRVLEQAFQGGVMLKVGGSDQLVVLLRSRGRWEKHRDTWSVGADGASASSGLPPPPGALTPTRSFGKLWSDSPDLRAALGWAVYEAREMRAGIMQCEQGTAIAIGQLAYLLTSDGRWKAIPLGS